PDALPTDASGAIRTVLRILDAWEATPLEAQQLLGIAPSTYRAWRKNPPARPAHERLMRVSYVLGIWKALNVLLPSAEICRRWPRSPNSAPLFRGKTPMEVLASGDPDALRDVREWLDGLLI